MSNLSQAKEIAKQYGVPVSSVMTEYNKVIMAERQNKPTPIFNLGYKRGIHVIPGGKV